MDQRIQRAFGRGPPCPRRETPSDKGRVAQVIDERGDVMAVVGVGVAQLGADFGGGLAKPFQFDGRQPPSVVDMRWGMGHGVCRGRGHMAGVTGDAFRPDAALARLDVHAVYRVWLVAQPFPHRLATVAHMAVGAARVRGDGKDALPCRKALFAGGVLRRLLCGGGGGQQGGAKGQVFHAKSTELENGKSRMRWPVAAKIAFASAGAAGGTPGSPTPRSLPPFSSPRTSILGV